MSKDYYSILGVDKSASQDEVKKAFRKLAHLHHPDKKSGDEAKFKELNEAYQVLGNVEKRKQYDQYGATFDQQGGFGGGMNWDDFMQGAKQGGFAGNSQGANFDFGDLNEIFGDIFGFGGGRRASRNSQAANQGRDIEVSLELTFEEAVFGVEKDVELYKEAECPDCSGTGGAQGATENQCPQCQGQGVVEEMTRSLFGMIRNQRVCPTCQGMGKTYSEKCKTCNGEGRFKQTKTVTVKIPAGVDSGQTIRLQGQGEAGSRGSQAGDLYLQIYVKDSSEFIRQGENIVSQEVINPAQATLGTKLDIKTIHGEVELKIPAGTQSSEAFRLRSKGVPRLNSGVHGDHLVEIIVEIPKKLSRQQKKLYQELLAN